MLRNEEKALRKVQIHYIPYIRCTRLIIDGIERIDGVSRLAEFVIDQPLDKWLAPYTFSYQKWNGILPELMNDLNDDELEISIFAPPEYFPQVQEEFDKQKLNVGEEGYCPDKYRLICVERFLPQNVCDILSRFVWNEKQFAPDQLSMNLFECVENAIKSSKDCSIEYLCKVCEELQNTLETAKEFCRRTQGNTQHWERAQRELKKILKNC